MPATHGNAGAPGTELAFAKAVSCRPHGLLGWKPRTLNHTTAIFRQVNKDYPRTHHDALEFPDGQMVLLLEALYNQRRKDLVNLDQELGGLPVPHSATESILRQLGKKV
jgi:hypothetical protein